MISNIFFSNNIDSNNLYKYEESFLEFIIAKKLYEYGPMTEIQIIDWISDFYCSLINRSKCTIFISKKFPYEKNRYILTTVQRTSLNKTAEFKENFSN